MKGLLVLFITILLFSPVAAQSNAGKQNEKRPTSKIIDADKLLRDVETLSSDAMEGRGTGTLGGEKARAYVAAAFEKAGLKKFGDTYLQAFEFKNRNGQTIGGANVVGYLEGRKYKDRYIVVTAHYDHLGVIKGDIYNGADDNASGTAALFALAAYFQKNRPDHSLIFVGFDGEERGLRGSRKFVDEPPVKLESILLNVNLDMISHNDKNELYAAGTFLYPAFKARLERVAAGAKIRLLLGHDRPELGEGDWTNQSDHFAFHQKKIPFVYFGVEDHKDYHQPSDEFATINQEFYVRAVETILEAVRGFDQDLK
ncbi:MAG: M28 family peptidase [Acidobacteria bacterium]|nr:M28 family peptidase [Acidobacteriota bacterium]